MDDLSSSEDAGIVPQALEILAGLASLGISQSLRNQVQIALVDISEAAGVTSDPQLQAFGGVASGRTATDKTASPPASRDSVLQRKVAELEQKMTMSRSIMKKLYHKNVELEKELAVVKANRGGVDLTPPPTALTGATHGSLRPSTAGPGLADATPSSQALQERDLTIRQLQQALEASRRRCALLEMQLANGPVGGPAAAVGAAAGRGGGGAGGGGAVGLGVSPESLRDVLAQSALHHQKYRQIREDYNRLLNKRAATLQAGSRGALTNTGTAAARALVEDLQKRLESEVQEREAEAALFSAKLYESEKAMSDWYVEKRLLEEHIARLSGELSERDKIDGEIEGCVTSMMERLRAVEAENEELRARLAATARAE